MNNKIISFEDYDSTIILIESVYIGLFLSIFLYPGWILGMCIGYKFKIKFPNESVLNFVSGIFIGGFMTWVVVIFFTNYYFHYSNLKIFIMFSGASISIIIGTLLHGLQDFTSTIFYQIKAYLK